MVLSTVDSRNTNQANQVYLTREVPLIRFPERSRERRRSKLEIRQLFARTWVSALKAVPTPGGQWSWTM
ncbi:hypothetical protein EMCG_03380 [[Emmonsia] crescens]|uniref:Uncharacterized protein n=1 Tax=[Emmonsia] crescens TaxID=73230 RepID=A0A0G2J8F4_9EURO|nr:hypothetical protein EMCG_03380 [Emmonsia crescens UAMH 3008]